jgi:hypothetical protein
MYIYLVEPVQCTPNKSQLPMFFAYKQLQLELAVNMSGIPARLLHESLGHIITVELKTGQSYHGQLAEGARSYF